MTALLLLAAAVVAAPPATVAADRAAAFHRPRAEPEPGPVTGFARRLRARLSGPGGAPPELPRAVDLLAVCLAAGLPTHAALEAVAEALGEDSPVGRVLAEVAGRLRLGADPRSAWAHATDASPALAQGLLPVATAIARSGEAGGAVGPALEHAAHRLRSEADAAALARAERAGVLVAGPLGLCFLPAFVCLGVVPVVLGLAGRILPGLSP